MYWKRDVGAYIMESKFVLLSKSASEGGRFSAVPSSVASSALTYFFCPTFFIIQIVDFKKQIAVLVENLLSIGSYTIYYF